MQLSRITAKALGFKYTATKVDYNKYGSLKINGEIIHKYSYVIVNIRNLIISELMFDILKKAGYVENTTCEGAYIKVTLNQKYFDDLENKQEI